MKRLGAFRQRFTARRWRGTGGATTVTSPLSYTAQESAMSRHFFQRAFSFFLAATVTLGLLGGIERLSMPDEAAAQWAQATASRA